MQTEYSSLATSLQSDYTLGPPIEIGELKIIPAYRCMVTATDFAVLALVSPAAIVVVRGSSIEVMELKDDVGEPKVRDTSQGG